MKKSGELLLLTVILSLCVISVVLSGCAAGMVALALDRWSDWFQSSDDDAGSYHILVDGYDIGARATPSGLMKLHGLAVGRDYLVSVVKPPNMIRGLHAVVRLDATRTIDLRNSNLFEGRVIRGSVRRDSSSGPLLPNVRVIALRNGPALLAGRPTPLDIPPGTTDGIDYMMGYTDQDGKYRLGPAWYGHWVVVVAIAGHVADAKAVDVSSNSDGLADLIVEEIADADTATATGTVNSGSGSPIAGAVITAMLGTPYSPQIRPAARTQVEDHSGLSMPEGAWFAFEALTTIASDTGQYSFAVPPGSHELEAYAYPHDANSVQLNFTAGGAQTHNFTLD